MKKICKLFIVLGIILCIFTIFGCDANESETSFSTEETDGETLESSAADEPGEEILETNTEKPEGNTTESSESEKTDGGITEENNSEETLEGLFVPDENLVAAVIDYLEEISADLSHPDTYSKMTEQIDQINRGAHLLQIEFDPDKYYYVCAYYSPEHLEEESNYCCSAEYTWVGFNSEELITEYYNDAKLLVAIQINKTKLCIDISHNDRNVPEVEYFHVYSPIFSDGINTEKSIAFEDKMIYLNSTDAPVVYTCWSYIYHDFSAMYYVSLDSHNYIVYDHTEHTNNVENKEDFKGVFGNYYDQLIEIMITDKYFTTNSNGEKIYYGIFDIEEFINAITK